MSKEEIKTFIEKEKNISDNIIRLVFSNNKLATSLVINILHCNHFFFHCICCSCNHLLISFFTIRVTLCISFPQQLYCCFQDETPALRGKT